MSQEITNPMRQQPVEPPENDSVTVVYSSAKNVKCLVEDGSGEVTTVPQATINGETQPTWKFGSGSGEKKEAGINSITKITIMGKSRVNKFTITSN